MGMPCLRRGSEGGLVESFWSSPTSFVVGGLRCRTSVGSMVKIEGLRIPVALEVEN